MGKAPIGDPEADELGNGLIFGRKVTRALQERSAPDRSAAAVGAERPGCGDAAQANQSIISEQELMADGGRPPANRAPPRRGAAAPHLSQCSMAGTSVA